MIVMFRAGEVEDHQHVDREHSEPNSENDELGHHDGLGEGLECLPNRHVRHVVSGGRDGMRDQWTVGFAGLGHREITRPVHVLGEVGRDVSLEAFDMVSKAY